MLTGAEQRLLDRPAAPGGAARPARRDRRCRLAPDVAPDSPDLGVMLPYTPVHHLLFGLPGDPPGPASW